MSANPHPRVLVCGATGRLGQLLVPRLLARQARPRVFVRQAATAQALWGNTVEVAQGRFEDATALGQALVGIDRLFLLSPITPTLAEQQLRVVEAARAAGVQHIVKLSGSDWTIAPPGRSLSGDAHRRIEEGLQASGISHTVLRPNAWMQVGLSRIAADLRSGDVLRSQHLGAGVSYLDARDIADVAVEALLNPEPAQQRLGAPGPWVLTGSQALRPQKLAEIASRLLGRPITAAAPVAAPVTDPFITQVHGEFFALMRAGHAAAVTATVRQVLGREPRTVEGFLAEELGSLAVAA
ncbi:NAD(P)H-binding protein [Comamonas sp.]|uniref:NAD(P)H-binding protein n=1 Tax=Comamonas sp. TaxID=34028 RepID=UPI00289AE5A6|nr:NAD(P)H-binding protein [Comamonas sp.]